MIILGSGEERDEWREKGKEMREDGAERGRWIRWKDVFF
jgi:hypothetical protein